MQVYISDQLLCLFVLQAVESMEIDPSETPSTSNQSHTAEFYSTQDKGTSTDVHIPPSVPLYNVVDGGSSEVLNENNQELSFCTLL